MFGREAIEMNSVIMVLPTVPQPQAGRPYTGADTKGL